MALATGNAHAATSADPGAPPTLDPAQVDLARLISCQDTPENFLPLAIAIQDPLQAVALGWRPLPQANMFMSEYLLNQPITVLGHRTDHIAFAGSSVMAVLDLPDPRPLARQLQLETALDTPEKAMFGKEVLSEPFIDGDGKAQVRSMILNVSNVTSHPGKTLLGCTYSIDPEEEPAESPASIAAPAAH
ncbi:hypothetical protein ABB29_08235 [Pseudoxanthomonas dokdonensis]|uniref:Uncharacterized protein n=1 Tax=Pseudoxanthomonas dokdonensis TaxID=344882 RepID=A0A0R0CXM3_9GAMM|nr:hypothetical protein ABB29_08235 [Pseudoxanthomonas dokdonensis]